jgi:hypothetical protein
MASDDYSGTCFKKGRGMARRSLGRLICISHQPLLDGARALLAAGADPETAIAIQHDGAHYVAMTSTIGTAAIVTMRFSGAPVSETGRHAGRIHEGAPG